jgi:hypothetical protein
MGVHDDDPHFDFDVLTVETSIAISSLLFSRHQPSNQTRFNGGVLAPSAETGC